MKNLVNRDESRKCWMCDNAATSAEHKIKCSVLKSAFPNTSLKIGDRLIKTNSAGERCVVQGWQSKEVKYKKNLCENCNGSVSQAWDRAYDDLVSFISKNPELVYKKKIVDLRLVYGGEVKKRQMSLFQYFAKAFGCSIYDANCEVPPVILDVVSGRVYGKSFFITVAAIEEIYNRNPAIEGLLGCSDLKSWNDGNIPVAWLWSQNLAWFVITYRCNLVTPSNSIPWVGKSKKITLS